MVTDFSPLTVWIYDEFYVRLAAQNYDPNALGISSHLTNNCIVKRILKKEYLENDGEVEDEEEIYNNLWSQDQLKDYIQAKYGDDMRFEKYSNILKEHIRVKIEKQVIASTQCVQEDIKNRKNSF